MFVDVLFVVFVVRLLAAICLLFADWCLLCDVCIALRCLLCVAVCCVLWIVRLLFVVWCSLLPFVVWCVLFVVW